MKTNTIPGDVRSSRVVEEIMFQASILALQAAIVSAGRGEPAENANMDDQLKSLVKRALRPAHKVEPSPRPDRRGM
jgi:hypothetical protein